MRRVLALCAIAVLAGCGGRTADEAAPVPNRPLEAYARQGLITGDDAFPAVAGFATLAGPGDSTWVLFALSLPASALRFHRDGAGFAAGYSVSLRFQRDGVELKRSDRSAQVRVRSFEETGRTEESIIYQDHVALEPGRYVVDVAVRDSIGTRGLLAEDTLDVPAYAAGGTALVPVHQAVPRGHRGAPPRLIVNARRAAAFGGPAPLVYVESYDSAAALDVLVRDEADATLLSLAVPMDRDSGADFASAVVTLPVDSLPLGVSTIEARGAASSAALALLVTISDQWMVANYDEVLDYLAYVASREEIETLRSAASAAERRAAWDAFWARRDPVPASPINEYREEFFERVRVAAEQFAESGRPGWRTDRGEVYIVLGAPDRVVTGQIERRDIAGALDAIEWLYDRPRRGTIELLFLDRDGFGRYEMTRSSEVAFRAIADRMRARNE